LLMAVDDKGCPGEPGKVAPMVDRNRCEAKEDCVRVCPYDVFEVRPLTPELRKSLSWVAWLKALAHGNRQAFVVKPNECHACGLCLTACPENALKLEALQA